MRALTVAAGLLLSAMTVRGIEIPFAPSVPGPAPEIASSGRVATGPDASLVAWIDGRGGVFGALLGKDGKPLGERNLLLAARNTPGGTIQVGAGASGFLVAYDYYDETANHSRRIGLILVTGNGVAIPMATSIAGIAVDSVTWTGGYYLVAYRGTPSPRELFAIIDPNASLVAVDLPFFLSSADADPTVTVAGGRPGEFLAAWAESSDQRIHAFRTTLEQLRRGVEFVARNPGPLATSHLVVQPTVVWNGTAYLIGWIDSEFGLFPPFATMSSVRTRMIDTNANAVGDVATIAVDAQEGMVYVQQIQAAWNGEGFLLGYRLGARLSAADLNASGVADGAPHQVSTDPENVLVGVAGAAGHDAIVLLDSSRNVQAVPFTGDDARPVNLRISLPAQVLATTADCGMGRLFAWVDRGRASDTLYVAAQGVDHSGAAPIAAIQTSYVYSLSLACNANTAVMAVSQNVVDNRSSSGLVRLLSVSLATGAVEERLVTPAPVGTTITPGTALVAWNGQEFLAAWQSDRREMNLIRLRGDGLPSDALPYVLEHARTEVSRVGDVPLALTWAGDSWFLARGHEHSAYLPVPFTPPVATTRELQGVFLSTGLQQVGSIVQLTPAAAAEGSDVFDAAVSWNGTSALTAWTQKIGWNGDWHVTTARTSSNGMIDLRVDLGAAPQYTHVSVRPWQSGSAIGWGNQLATVAADGFIERRALDPGATIQVLLPNAPADAMLLTRPDPTDLVARLWMSWPSARRRIAR